MAISDICSHYCLEILKNISLQLQNILHSSEQGICSLECLYHCHYTERSLAVPISLSWSSRNKSYELTNISFFLEIRDIWNTSHLDGDLRVSGNNIPPEWFDRYTNVMGNAGSRIFTSNLYLETFSFIFVLSKKLYLDPEKSQVYNYHKNHVKTDRCIKIPIKPTLKCLKIQ